MRTPPAEQRDARVTLADTDQDSRAHRDPRPRVEVVAHRDLVGGAAGEVAVRAPLQDARGGRLVVGYGNQRLGVVRHYPQSYGKCGAGLQASRKFPLVAGICMKCEVLAFSGIRRCTVGERSALMPPSAVELQRRTGEGPAMAERRIGTAAASCESCYFRQNLLCAVSDSGPCATYRPNHPDGLRPPSQMRFVFRQERRMQVAWAFPSANEQVALHA